MTQLFVNNATSTLAAPITAAATSMSVQAGHGARFPQPAAGDYFLVTLFQLINGIESNHEIVKVTARSVDTFTIVRPQEGTAARAWSTGDQISMRSTAGTLAGMAQLGAPAVFTQTVNVPTAAAGTNTTQAATTAFVTGAVAQAKADLVASSPAALDTLNELAAALGNDANFAVTMTTSLGNRLRVDVNTQGLTAQQKANAATNMGLATVATTGSKIDVGLDQVDNTSDANKPVSTAQQTALNSKAASGANNDITSLSGMTTALSIAQGGTGAKTATAALTALGGMNSTDVANAMAAYGIGTTNAAPAALDLDDATVKSGMYYTSSTTLGTWPAGVAATGGWLLTKVYGNAGFQMLQPYNTDRLFFRRRNAAAWVAWNEVPTLTAAAFTGSVTVPDQVAGNSSSAAANTRFVTTAVANLVASSPAALDTLNELATALGNDPAFATTMTTALGNRLRVDAAQALTAPQQAQGRANLALDQLNNTSDANKPVSTAQQTALNAKQDTSAKDATGGYVGLTGFAINLKNALGTILSSIVSAATAARTYTFPDKNITVAGTTNETHVAPVFKDYIEQFQALNPGAAITIDQSLGTLIKITTTVASTTVTLPPRVAGKSCTVIVKYGATGHAVSFVVSGGTTLAWFGGAAPTATSTVGKRDKLIFTNDDEVTMGQDGGRNA